MDTWTVPDYSGSNNLKLKILRKYESSNIVVRFAKCQNSFILISL